MKMNCKSNFNQRSHVFDAEHLHAVQMTKTVLVEHDEVLLGF